MNLIHKGAMEGTIFDSAHTDKVIQERLNRRSTKERRQAIKGSIQVEQILDYTARLARSLTQNRATFERVRKLKERETPTYHEKCKQLLELTFFQFSNFFHACLQKLEGLTTSTYLDYRRKLVSFGGKESKIFAEIMTWREASEVALWQCLNRILDNFKAKVWKLNDEARDNTIGRSRSKSRDLSDDKKSKGKNFSFFR